MVVLEPSLVFDWAPERMGAAPGGVSIDGAVCAGLPVVEGMVFDDGTSDPCNFGFAVLVVAGLSVPGTVLIGASPGAVLVVGGMVVEGLFVGGPSFDGVEL